MEVENQSIFEEEVDNQFASDPVSDSPLDQYAVKGDSKNTV